MAEPRKKSGKITMINLIDLICRRDCLENMRL